MSDFFVNTNNYGIILLRNSYEEALAESQEMYDWECERKKCPTPKAERGTTYLLGVKQNVLSGQVGLCLPPRHPQVQVPVAAIRCEHVDNPLWMDYDWLNGPSKMVLGALPFGGFGFGIVDPGHMRKILDGNLSQELLRQVRGSTRKYTVEVHSQVSRFLDDLLKQQKIRRHLLGNLNGSFFEELVADLLRAKGMDVFLTSRTGDGGKDIWVSMIHEGKRTLALVECKVRSGTGAIDPAIARAVVGAFFIERNRGVDVDCAVMVTTSDNIGPESLAIQQAMREFSVKDCNDVLNWVKDYGAIRNGLWVPKAFSDYLL